MLLPRSFPRQRPAGGRPLTTTQRAIRRRRQPTINVSIDGQNCNHDALKTRRVLTLGPIRDHPGESIFTLDTYDTSMSGLASSYSYSVTKACKGC